MAEKKFGATSDNGHSFDQSVDLKKVSVHILSNPSEHILPRTLFVSRVTKMSTVLFKVLTVSWMHTTNDDPIRRTKM